MFALSRPGLPPVRGERQPSPRPGSPSCRCCQGGQQASTCRYACCEADGGLMGSLGPSTGNRAPLVCRLPWQLWLAPSPLIPEPAADREASMAHPREPREPVVELERRYALRGTEVLERLRQVKAERGQITGADVDEVAAQVGIPRAHVYGTTTFFEELSTRRRGERHVQVCAGTACFAASHGRHLPAVERALGIARGATSADGSTSLQPVYCLGYCYGGPAALDGEAAYVGPDLVAQLTGSAPPHDPPIPAYA